MLPIRKIRERIEVERAESDTALFGALMLEGEMILKLVVAGMVSAIGIDKERHRYRQVHRLVRSDGLGDWPDVLDEVLLGPPSQYLNPEAAIAQRQLTQNLGPDTWQYQCVSLIQECLTAVDVTLPDLPPRIQGRSFFRHFVRLRNETRGHGAPLSDHLSRACPSLESALKLLSDNFDLFGRPWAYLRRNLSGKYRVTAWTHTTERLEQLKRDTNETLPDGDGVYLDFDGDLCPVQLVVSTPDAEDVWLANGNFNENDHQFISYVTNDRIRRPSHPYLTPAEQLPPSETEGLGHLDVRGNTFNNLPLQPPGYIQRGQLEGSLERQLRLTDRHPIVSLTGRGGIGKTSLALAVISGLMESEDCPYEVVVWFSARDVDLLQQGPRIVQPHGVSVDDFAREYVRLVQPNSQHPKGFKAVQFLASEISGESIGPTLYIFDNFETTSNPNEIYTWLDSFIRPPNKILLTSRQRQFTGDYAVQVGGMTEDECEKLVDSTSTSLGIREILTTEYIGQVIHESNGHPYVIRLMLGEVARTGQLGHVERVLATQEETLMALFERTYTNLSPAAKRVFLTLCNWRSTVPGIAVAAVLLRPENEQIDVQQAIDDLSRSSFVEEINIDSTNEFEISVPLAARLFGQRKLEASPWRASIQADTELLHLFGPMSLSGRDINSDRRIRRLFNNVAQAIVRGQRQLSEVMPVLQYVASQYSAAWVFMADLLEEIGDERSEQEEESYLYKYVEKPDSSQFPASEIWLRIADRKRRSGDSQGEIHALAQICRQPEVPLYVLSNSSNRINSVLRLSQPVDLTREEKQFLLRDVAQAMEESSDSMDADDCSRLGWLYLHLDEQSLAEATAIRGVGLDPTNEHCLGLCRRLGIDPDRVSNPS